MDSSELLQYFPPDRVACISKAGYFMGNHKERYEHIGITSFFAIGNGGVTKLYDAACHAALRRWAENCNWIVGTLMYPEAQLAGGSSRGYLHKLTRKKYLKWLFNRSPWAGTFYNTEPPAEGEFVYSRTDVPANLMAGGLIAFRAIYEYPHIVTNWSWLVRNGVKESYAFILAHSMLGRTEGIPCVPGSPDNHHAVSGISMSDEFIKNFCKGKMAIANFSYVSGAPYTQVNAAWGAASAGSDVNRDELTSYLEKRTDVERIVERWAGSEVVKYFSTVDEYREAFLEFALKHQKRLGL